MKVGAKFNKGSSDIIIESINGDMATCRLITKEGKESKVYYKMDDLRKMGVQTLHG